MLEYVPYFFTRMALIVVDSIIRAAQSSAEAIGMLKVYPQQVWKKTAFGTWGSMPLKIAVKILRRVMKNFEGFMIVIKYRLYYESVTGQMKQHYKELRRKRGSP